MRQLWILTLHLAALGSMATLSDLAVWFLQKGVSLINTELVWSGRLRLWCLPHRGQPDGMKANTADYRAAHWAPYQQALHAGRIGHLMVEMEIHSESPILVPCVEVYSDAETPHQAGWPVHFALHAPVEALDPAATDRWQQRWVDLGTQCFEQLVDGSGYMMIDQAGPLNATSTYETHRGIGFDQLSYLGRLVRGYFWGNWLTQLQIDALGGIQEVERRCPCYSVTRNRCGAFLQLTEWVNQVSIEQLRRLKQYLLPLLPEGDRPLIWNNRTLAYQLDYDGEYDPVNGQTHFYDRNGDEQSNA